MPVGDAARPGADLGSERDGLTVDRRMGRRTQRGVRGCRGDDLGQRRRHARGEAVVALVAGADRVMAGGEGNRGQAGHVSSGHARERDGRLCNAVDREDDVARGCAAGHARRRSP